MEPTGNILAVHRERKSGCGTKDVFETKLARIHTDGTVENLLRLRERCIDPAISALDKAVASGALYDPIEGELLVSFLLSQQTQGTTVYPAQTHVHRIHGLPNQFDIMVTFTPSTAQLTWSSPFMPMGLPARAADSFDVFRGDLHALNSRGPAAFASMEPVACDVGGEELPEVGRRHVVPLPPMASDREFYLVAAKAGGEVRYGRWLLESGGMVKGRNQALLPECVEGSN